MERRLKRPVVSIPYRGKMRTFHIQKMKENGDSFYRALSYIFFNSQSVAFRELRSVITNHITDNFDIYRDVLAKHPRRPYFSARAYARDMRRTGAYASFPEVVASANFCGFKIIVIEDDNVVFQSGVSNEVYFLSFSSFAHLGHFHLLIPTEREAHYNRRTPVIDKIIEKELRKVIQKVHPTEARAGEERVDTSDLEDAFVRRLQLSEEPSTSEKQTEKPKKKKKKKK